VVWPGIIEITYQKTELSLSFQTSFFQFVELGSIVQFSGWCPCLDLESYFSSFFITSCTSNNSRHPNSRQKQNIRTANELFEKVAKFKYLGTTLANQNDTHETKSRLNSGNACYYSVQNLLSSRLISKNLKIKIYGTVTLPVALYGCKTWSLILGE
jgi:hypothetical protein